MDTEIKSKRGGWGSNFGFLMASIGSAVGLGNIWGFPYKMGKSGGAVFLLLYLVLVVLVGVTVMLGELADAGVDIDLCGHTHDGQMFPGNLTIKLMWENACGYLQKGKMHNIVTSGVGLFGPNMRVGTKAEICPITIYFA